MLLMGWQKSTSAIDLVDIWSECLSPLRFAQGQALSPFASLRVNSAKGLARRTKRSFVSLRMTARTPLKSAHGKPSLQRSIDLGRTLCLAPMPVLSKQIEENLLLWMLANHLLVEFYSKSWPLREREVSFYYAGISRCGRFYPLLSKVVKVFLNIEVRCGGCKVERCS